jgi:hypothetical protein
MSLFRTALLADVVGVSALGGRARAVAGRPRAGRAAEDRVPSSRVPRSLAQADAVVAVIGVVLAAMADRERRRGPAGVGRARALIDTGLVVTVVGCLAVDLRSRWQVAPGGRRGGPARAALLVGGVGVSIVYRRALAPRRARSIR